MAAPLIADPALRARLLLRWRWLVFLSATLGYGCFYTTRLGLSVTKRPLLDANLLSTAQLGRVGSALLLGYAVGKAVNGLLSDRVHLPRFFTSGLMLSALVNILFGLSDSYLAFLLLWTMNGWFQSVGAASCGVSLARWFPPGALGTRYALWSLSHNIGEGITFAGTGLLVAAYGWRWGFFAPGLLCLLACAVLMRTMADHPGALGLDAQHRPALAASEVATEESADEQSIGAAQRAALREPMVWVLGLASASMYVTRYAVSNWGILYLQSDRGYSLVEAGFALSLVPLVGAVGAVCSGLVSDRLFSGQRGVVTVAYGVLLVVALFALLFLPPAHPALLSVALGAIGFAIGGQLVFLGGLAAIELCSKRASGAVLGLVGALSYLGAAGQDLLSGALIQPVAGAAQRYDFSRVKLFWLGAAVLSLLLALPLLHAERTARRHKARSSHEAQGAPDPGAPDPQDGDEAEA